MSSDDTFRSKKLPEHLLNDLLDKIDATENASKRNRRKTDRLPYRKRDLALHIVHPGGGIIDCEVSTRNLSPTGVSFLYWNYLHTGTVCKIHLKRHLGGIEAVEGTVVWCRHVVGPHHLVGLRFKNRIYQKLFVNPSLLESVDSADLVDPRNLTGRLLHVEDQHVERQLFKHTLNKTAIQVVSVANETDGCAELGKAKFDVIVCDLDLGTTTADKAIPLFRKCGHTGPILCCTAENTPSKLAAVQAAGAIAIIQKPCSPARVYSILNSVMGTSTVPLNERIFSELAGKDEMDQLIESYVNETKTLLSELKREIQVNHFERVRQILTTIKGSAGGYGFAILSTAAQDAIKCLDDTLSVAQSALQLQQVEETARRISSGTPASIPG